jgi:cytosine/adenosine deaminase-related metal-dependent hydrolase
VKQGFSLGTVGGARAVAMEKEVGKLKEGMKADLVASDGLSLAILAVEEDPVAAVALHRSPRYIDMVLVDGVIRKEGGRLVDVEVKAAPRGEGMSRAWWTSGRK